MEQENKTKTKKHLKQRAMHETGFPLRVQLPCAWLAQPNILFIHRFHRLHRLRAPQEICANPPRRTSLRNVPAVQDFGRRVCGDNFFLVAAMVRCVLCLSVVIMLSILLILSKNKDGQGLADLY